jgi:uncharacterized protein YkwD
MKRTLLITATIWLLIAGTPLAQGEGPVDETRFVLRNELVRMINRDRARYGLGAVELDATTSVLADAYCRQQIRNGTTGHFTTNGEAPYMRYSFAGGNDAVSENAAAWSASYNFTDRALYEMMRRSEEAMMEEKAPHDGHRKTILDPHANYVGIGLAWERGEFRLTQEFIRRYVEWARPLPRAATPEDRVLATGRAVPGYEVDAISVHHEPLPQSISAMTANLIDTYSLPDKRRDYLPRIRGERGDFQVANDGTFSFAVPFRDGPGVYTVVVWVHKTGTRVPISASNVSIRVAGEPAATVFSTR